MKPQKTLFSSEPIEDETRHEHREFAFADLSAGTPSLPRDGTSASRFPRQAWSAECPVFLGFVRSSDRICRQADIGRVHAEGSRFVGGAGNTGRLFLFRLQIPETDCIPVDFENDRLASDRANRDRGDRDPAVGRNDRCGGLPGMPAPETRDPVFRPQENGDMGFLSVRLAGIHKDPRKPQGNWLEFVCQLLEIKDRRHRRRRGNPGIHNIYGMPVADGNHDPAQREDHREQYFFRVHQSQQCDA